MAKHHANHVTRRRVAEAISDVERADENEIDLVYDQDDSIEVTERKVHVACSKLVLNLKHHDARAYLQCLLAEFQGGPPVRVFQRALNSLDSITDSAWKQAQQDLKFFLRQQK